MSKNSSKKLYEQLIRYLNEINYGKGHKRIKDKHGNYIKVKK